MKPHMSSETSVFSFTLALVTFGFPQPKQPKDIGTPRTKLRSPNIMDQLNNIYANVEELSKSSESVYENVFIDTLKPSRNGPSPSGVGDVKKRSFKAVAVILGLLSFILLTGLITSVCLFTKGISEREMEMILLQTSNSNLTKERDQLQTSYTNLTNERDHFIKRVQNLEIELNFCQIRTQDNANRIIYNPRWPYHSGMRSRVRRDGNGWMGLR